MSLSLLNLQVSPETGVDMADNRGGRDSEAEGFW